jgi:hypothetical protein
MSLRPLAYAGVVTLSLGLACLVGFRLSADALALLAGVAIGWTAGLPGQYFLFRLARRPGPAGPSEMQPAQIAPANPPPGPRTFVFVDEDSAIRLPALVLR